MYIIFKRNANIYKSLGIIFKMDHKKSPWTLAPKSVQDTISKNVK